MVLQFRGARAPVVDEWFLTASGIKRRIEVRTMNFNLIPQFVVGTRRIATIPRRLAEFYARHLPLRIMDPPFELPKLKEAMQWHTLFDKDPAGVWLRGLLKQVAAEE